MSDVVMRLVFTLALMPMGVAVAALVSSTGLSLWRSNTFWEMATATTMVIAGTRASASGSE